MRPSLTPDRSVSLPARRLAVLLASVSPVLHAAEIFKADNIDDMSATSSWEGGVLPGASDIAVFDSRIASGQFMPLTPSATWGGIKIVGNAAGLTFDTLFAPTTPVLTLNSGGIDMSGGTSGTTFTFDSPTTALAAGLGQTWSVADGATLRMRGALSRGTGATLNYSLGNTGTGVIVVEASTFGSSGALATFATVSGRDIAAVTTDGSSRRVVAPGASVVTYTPNPATALATDLPNFTGSVTVMDFINANANATSGVRISASAGINAAGLRFNQPHTIPWVIDTAARNLNIGNGTLLVTPNVGATTVRVDGTGNLRLGQGQDFFVHQFNTGADLIINANISQSGTNPTNAGSRLTKAGAGKLIITSNGNNLWGTTTINEGTLQVGNNGATGVIGASNSPVVNNATLSFARTDSYSVSNIISGTGQLTHAGTGTLTLAGVNTFTGSVNANAGKLAFSDATNLGAGTVINFNGGALQWATGNTLDISTRALNFVSSTAGFDTNGNNVTLANSIGNGGAGGLSKQGAGTLTLTAANSYTGSTTVTAGALRVANTTGSATGSGAVTVAAGGVLTGAGTISGAVTVSSSGKVAPGSSGVGTLTVGSLSLASGSLLDLEFAGTSSYDKVNVTNPGGLGISGGAVNVYTEGGTSSYATPGTYNLIQYSGALAGTGASALSVLNPQAGYSYTFGTSSGNVTLTITQLGMITQWTASGSGSFGASGNWNNGTPTGNGATANFTTSLATDAVVTLDGTRTLGGLAFNSSPGGYTIAQGTGGNLILDNGNSDIAVNVLAGNHFITAPIALTGNLAISTAESSSLSITGAVGGTGNVVKSGAGTLALSGTNAITGATTVAGGTLEFGSLASIGNGSITLNGGTLRYGAGNTADISARTVAFGANGATIDTNGNDVTFAAGVGDGGAGGFTKSGAGTLTLSAANTYGGATTISGGTLKIGGDAFLNASPLGVTLDGGTLEASASFATARTLTVGAAGGGLKVDTGATLTVNSALAGTGLITKSGAGDLSLTTASTFNGGIRLAEGSIALSNSTGAGTGSVTMANGTTYTVAVNASTFAVTPLILDTGATATLLSTNITGGFSGSNVTGDATSKLVIGGNTQINFGAANTQQLAAMLGTVEVLSDATLRFSNTSLNNGGQSATFNVVGTITGRNNGTVHLGKLTGAGIITGSGGADNNTTIYSIGAKNEDSVFAGSIRDADLALGRRAAVTKVGTGVLTLSGVNTYTGATNVNAGTLRIDGSLDATAVTVAAGGALAGSGTIVGGVTINNGILRPGVSSSGDALLTINGSLALAGAASPVSSVTQFDFDGAAYTGIKANGGVTYAGTLDLNFTRSIYNRSYALFQITGGQSGAFSGVRATSAVTTTPVDLAETSPGSGVWTGVIDGASLTFTASSGVLAVTGGVGSAGAPGASTLSATAGNATVNLTWTSASGADTYTVKRATTAGGPYANVIANLAGTSYSDTTVTNGTTYYYVVQAKNTSSGLTGPLSNEVPATPVAGVTHTGLQTWRFEQFGVYDDDGTVLAGDSEDYDGDGLANLMEYALGTNPKVANASPVTVSKSGNFLTLTYPRRSPADASLTYAVQGSSNLAGGFTSATGATNTAGSTSTYTDDVNVSTAGVRRFLRLSVSYGTAP